MARLPRFVLPGHPQHVIQRGNNRQSIFVTDEDYRFYLAKLGAACQHHHCDVHAYVLMTNHVHLLITPHHEPGIGNVMQSVGRSYVRYFNDTYHRTGTLWEGRYRATLIDTEQYLLICYRYIELNPVRAGMVADPAAYPWSSYHANALGQSDSLVTSHPLYQSLGKEAERRQAAYRGLFQQVIEPPTLAAIRESTNKAWVLGHERFVEAIATTLNRRAARKDRGGDHRSQAYREQKT
jgi:putative transposase